jgi:dihydroorotase
MSYLKISNIRQWHVEGGFSKPKEVVLPLDTESDVEINGTDKLLIPALTALYTDFLAPARDDLYTLHNGEAALLKGGFNAALYQSECNPLNNAEELSSFFSRVKNLKVELKPGACFLTNNNKGISELYTLNGLGPVVFVTSPQSLPDNNLIISLLEYARDLDYRLHFFPLDDDLSQGKIAVHEGEFADILGLKGLSSQSEEIAVFRLLTLVQKTKAKIHLRNISCQNSISLIREYRQIGLDITFDVSYLNLLLNDSVLLKLQPTSKVMPPLRPESDRLACDHAILTDEADAISINHLPVINDNKRTDFETAANGALGLELVLAALYDKCVKENDTEKMFASYIKKLSLGAREVAGIGQHADYLIMDTTEKTIASKDLFVGNVANSPLKDFVFQGRVSGLYIKKNLILV